MFLVYKIDLDFIKEKRIEKGYSLQKMVNILGILDKTKYYRRERGLVQFKPEELFRVAAILEVPIDAIVTLSVSEIETT